MWKMHLKLEQSKINCKLTLRKDQFPSAINRINQAITREPFIRALEKIKLNKWPSAKYWGEWLKWG